MNIFKQEKLVLSDWNHLDSPYNDSEKEILKLISKGYHDFNIFHYNYDNLKTIVKFDNINTDYIIYKTFIEPKLVKMKFDVKSVDNIKYKLNKADQIRLDKIKNDTNGKQEKSFEFLLLYILKIIYKSNKKDIKVDILKSIYTLTHLFYNNKLFINTYFIQFLENYIESKSEFMNNNIKNILKNCDYIIDNNELLTYKPVKLYSHQKEIFEIFKNKDLKEKSKLIFYTAPTGSGKTLTPVGLSNEYKILFICVSKHIGLALAKALIQEEKGIAFAFNCEKMEDIRLHHNAVATYEDIYKGKRKLRKIDNLDGSKVQVMISDLNSAYLAMLYMKSFSQENNLILFWDEPTITMDLVDHPFHKKINEFWKSCKIKNIILSSATLPSINSLDNMVNSFKEKHNDNKYYIKNVTSIDEMTNIKLVNTNGDMIIPHTYFKNDYNSLIEYINNYDTKYMKMFSCSECARFISFISKNYNYDLNSYFKDTLSITNYSIKQTYLDVIKRLKISKWNNAIDNYTLKYKNTLTGLYHNNGMELTGSSAFTLTNGPSLFITSNPDNVVKYLYSKAKVPKNMIDELVNNISKNMDIKEKINQLTKIYEDSISKIGNEEFNGNEKPDINKDNNESLKLKAEIFKLEKSLLQINLPYNLIPNTKDHYNKWNKNTDDDEKINQLFVPNVPEDYIEQVIEMDDVDNMYKILFMMGIGIFTNSNAEYNRIIKILADNKQLLLIIAESDYIYGTNYQFSHVFLGKDLENISFEKIIQSIGRVGRKEKNKEYTFRFRNDKHSELLFKSNETMEIECMNMNKLFIY